MPDDEKAEIDVDYDTLISDISDRNAEDSERAQSAGESRQKIKTFLDETGLHPKAYSFCRMVLKQKKYATQSDILRSMKEAMPHVEAYVMGNQADMFDNRSEAPEENPDPVEFADPDEKPADDYHDDAPATEEEAAEFNQAVDDVSDDKGNVTSIGARA